MTNNFRIVYCTTEDSELELKTLTALLVFLLPAPQDPKTTEKSEGPLTAG